MIDEELNEDIRKGDMLPEDAESEYRGRSGGNKAETRVKLKYCLFSNLILGMAILAYFLLKQQALVGYAGSVGPGTSVALDTVQVNLGGLKEQLRVRVVLEAKNQEYRNFLETKKFLLADTLIQIAQKKKSGELLRSSEQNRFKRELLEEFNYRLISKRGRINAIYFTEFVISETAGKTNRKKPDNG